MALPKNVFEQIAYYRKSGMHDDGVLLLSAVDDFIRWYETQPNFLKDFEKLQESLRKADQTSLDQLKTIETLRVQNLRLHDAHTRNMETISVLSRKPAEESSLRKMLLEEENKALRSLLSEIEEDEDSVDLDCYTQWQKSGTIRKLLDHLAAE